MAAALLGACPHCAPAPRPLVLPAPSHRPLWDSPCVWPGPAGREQPHRRVLGPGRLGLGLARLQPTGTAAIIGHICGRGGLRVSDYIWGLYSVGRKWATPLGRGGGLEPDPGCSHGTPPGCPPSAQSPLTRCPTTLRAEGEVGECGPSSETRGTKEAGSGTEESPRSHQGPTEVPREGPSLRARQGEWGGHPPVTAASQGARPRANRA